MVKSITSKSESVQIVYDQYLEGKYNVNRRYQRKLVWTLQEKQAFIDSIINQFSVPLFLLAQSEDAAGKTQYEIIDGMQRLNAIFSFIEDEYAVTYNGNEYYFNLDTLACTLELKNSGKLDQKQPVLNKEVCLQIVSYQIPFSYIIADKQSIEEIFRRINSFGKQLSGQEIRQAGAVGVFSDIVRVIASTIRGDVSNSEILPLNDMNKISISNYKLKYGIDINNIWWVKQHIITLANIRTSRDEELIAWIIAYIILGKQTSPSSKALNRLYRYDLLDQEGNNQAALVENRIRQIGAESIVTRFCKTFSLLLDILHSANKKFPELFFADEEPEGLVRSFQIVFLALYELDQNENQVIVDKKGLIAAISKSAKQILGGIKERVWVAESRYDLVQSFKGLINPYFKKRRNEDVSRDNWVLQLDNIMRLSLTEGSQYDFKAGFRTYNDGSLNVDCIKKCVKTLTAAVNKAPNTAGYIIVGVCESQDTLRDFRKFYNSNKGTQYDNSKFYIVGIDDEITKFYRGSIDNFQNDVIRVIQNEPICDYAKHYILTHMWIPRYYNSTILVLELKSQNTPITYADEYYERHGNNVAKVNGITAIKALETRFNS